MQVLRKPGASPLLFGKYLMESTAFITLEDISDQLPSYEESVLTVDMDPDLAKAYEAISEDITSAMQEHRGNKSLMSVLQKAGFRVAVLRSTVPTDKREAWYEKQLKEGVEVVICHPRLVETGLDLLAFPTLYFYETGYSLHTLRQASRRSWRIGQHLPVRVKFLAYSGTMQETCIRHMGKKMLVALMMEGKFSGEGLQSLDANEDLLTAMARELVEKGGVGETADAVWKDLERERAKHVPAPTPAAELIVLPVAPVEEQAGIESRPEPLPVPVLAGPQLVYPTKPRPKRKSAPLWPAGHTLGEQMRLFG